MATAADLVAPLQTSRLSSKAVRTALRTHDHLLQHRTEVSTDLSSRTTRALRANIGAFDWLFKPTQHVIEWAHLSSSSRQPPRGGGLTPGFTPLSFLARRLHLFMRLRQGWRPLHLVHQLRSMARYAAAHKDPKGPGDARPTALRVVEDESLVGKLPGKVFLITGCSSGIPLPAACTPRRRV